MKILYFGTVCDLDHYYEFIKGSKYIPSVAPIVFETALLRGFFQNDIEVEIHSYPMVPTFPACKRLRFGKKIEKLSCGFNCRWLNTVNLPIIKQISRRIDATKILRKWLKENGDDGVILTYSIPPFLIKSILKYAQKYSAKVIPVVTDLLQDMYVNDNSKAILKKLKDVYLKKALKLQSKCDAYIFLTEAMCEIVAPCKPYMIMEGIADVANSFDVDTEKASPRAIMYAGALHEKYGVMNLLEAFVRITDCNTQLWLFGDGTAVSDIKKLSAKNDRIKYFGALPRESVLEYEKKATLLVNPRDPKETFTKYSFPSKTIEYMLSGTPVLTTKLQGIPDEYYCYVFSVNDNSTKSLVEAIENVLKHTDEELNIVGKCAREYIIKNKNSKSQVGRILQFIDSLE